MLSYVSRAGLTSAVRGLQHYRGQGPRLLAGLPTVLVLKRLGVERGQYKRLAISDFQDVCHETLKVIVKGDPTSESGDRLYNPFSPGSKSPLVQPDWPRSTLWTRYGNQAWRGILSAQRDEYTLTWSLGEDYVDVLLKKLPGPLPAYHLAAFLFRRPSTVQGVGSIEKHDDLLEALQTYFKLEEADRALFDWSIPKDAPDLTDLELSHNECLEAIAAAEPSVARQLARAKSAGPSDLADEAVSCALDLGQVLLFGPPGTGKSYWAGLAAARLAGFPGDLAGAIDSGKVQLTVWHAGTSYEDFVRGVEVRNGSISPRPGLFQTFCEKASESTDPFVLIIDEINRANTVAVLGELLFALESNKRGVPFRLADGSEFSVPNNVFVVATANTADRSIASLDAALGRRFARIEVPPSPAELVGGSICGLPLGDVLDAVNRNIGSLVDREHRLGHAYFMDPDGNPLGSLEEFVFAMKYRVVPQIHDLAIDDYSLMEEILGPGFVDAARLDVRSDVFLDEDSLLEALEQIPGLVAT